MLGTRLALLAGGTMALLAAGCGRQPPPTAATPAVEPAPPAITVEAPPPPPPSLDEVIEHDPRYVVGISYPQEAAQWPGLARVLHDYAEAARAELAQAVAGVQEPPAAPYGLSLGFRILVQTPEVVAVAADGSLYTGGAHGQPLLERFVWLPGHDALLTSEQLLASPDGWQAVADHVAEQLATAAHTRAADPSLEPDERQRLLRTALSNIAAGTEPRPENFARFEPVTAGEDGRITALRFVFPPYQVGPYAAGVHEAEVPAAVLLPHVAPDYRGLFAP
ncbi:hypothetical protein [Pseudoxanthomonas koreensis]|uniref:DUF3298 and DUF4163 domain-containing protein n=1 Tax=Pseudoxanthomonas koreensis TaxID=266061 RepID=UPI0035A656B0